MKLRKLMGIDSISGKKILLRADLDVPVDDSLNITDLTRLKACLPTIRYLLDKGAKLAILTKIGRPEERRISTKILMPELEKSTEAKIVWIDSCEGPLVQKRLDDLRSQEILLLENIRFYPEEETQDIGFAKKLAAPFDIYVNEAFAMCHRKDVSITLVPKFLSHYAGFRLCKEIEVLSKVLESPQRPLIAVIGGAKIETKLPVIENLAKIADEVLVGGAIPYLPSPNSPHLPNLPNIITPRDNIDKRDIGPETIKLFRAEILNAKTIVWNGPMGVFEEVKYEKGTMEIAKAIAESAAYKVAGGGDTTSAIDKLGITEKFDFISTGGGAMLDFMAEKKLPGIEALK